MTMTSPRAEKVQNVQPGPTRSQQGAMPEVPPPKKAPIQKAMPPAKGAAGATPPEKSPPPKGPPPPGWVPPWGTTKSSMSSSCEGRTDPRRTGPTRGTIAGGEGGPAGGCLP